MQTHPRYALRRFLASLVLLGLALLAISALSLLK